MAGECHDSTGASFNASGMCEDSVAMHDYTEGRLMQWPDHCEAHTFGARFHVSMGKSRQPMIMKDIGEIALIFHLQELLDVHCI